MEILKPGTGRGGRPFAVIPGRQGHRQAEAKRSGERRFRHGMDLWHGRGAHDGAPTATGGRCGRRPGMHLEKPSPEPSCQRDPEGRMRRARGRAPRHGVRSRRRYTDPPPRGRAWPGALVVAPTPAPPCERPRTCRPLVRRGLYPSSERSAARHGTVPVACRGQAAADGASCCHSQGRVYAPRTRATSPGSASPVRCRRATRPRLGSSVTSATRADNPASASAAS